MHDPLLIDTQFSALKQSIPCIFSITAVYNHVDTKAPVLLYTTLIGCLQKSLVRNRGNGLGHVVLGRDVTSLARLSWETLQVDLDYYIDR